MLRHTHPNRATGPLVFNDTNSIPHQPRRASFRGGLGARRAREIGIRSGAAARHWNHRPFFEVRVLEEGCAPDLLGTGVLGGWRSASPDPMGPTGSSGSRSKQRRTPSRRHRRKHCSRAVVVTGVRVDVQARHGYPNSDGPAPLWCRASAEARASSQARAGRECKACG
jgi:hypothetical protein